MSVGNAQANAFLGTLPSTAYVQVHNGDPGPAGLNNVIAGAARGMVTFPAASGGQRSASGAVDCPGIPIGANVSHVSYWDQAVGGSFLFSEALAVTVTFIYAGRLRFTSQVFTVTTGSGGSQTQTSVNADSALAADTNVATHILRHTDTLSTSDSVGATVGVISANADSMSTSDAVGVGHLLHVVDSSAASDAVGVGHRLNVSDSMSSSDSTGAVVGAFTSVNDTASCSDSNAVTQTFVSSNVDTASIGDLGTAQVQSPPAGASFSDLFTRANGDVGTDYTTGGGAGATRPSINGGYVGMGLATDRVFVALATATFTANHKAQCTIINANDGGPAVRVSASARTYYAAIHWYDTEFGEGGINLVKYVNGVPTTLGSAAYNATQGTTGIQANGSIITVFSEGVAVITVTDTDITTGQPGFVGGSIDNFSAVDL